MIIYVSIGNSDDKLTQQRWSRYVTEVRAAIRKAVQESVALPAAVHGEWFSGADQPWQNAAWCFELSGYGAIPKRLQDDLCALALAFGQDSISWAVVQEQTLLKP